jgi:hypothetical protein
MKRREIIMSAFMNALGTAVYVILIALFIYLGSQGLFGEGESVFIPIAMLMLFVFSAAFTGFLIFGRPIMWYLDNKKKEALSLLFYTLIIFLIITIIALFFLMLLNA